MADFSQGTWTDKPKEEIANGGIDPNASPEAIAALQKALGPQQVMQKAGLIDDQGMSTLPDDGQTAPLVPDSPMPEGQPEAAPDQLNQAPSSPQSRPAAAPQAQAQAPVAAPTEPKVAPVPIPASPVSPPAVLGADIKTDDVAWANDLKNGHITPETYQSLFAKKDTLGKIGTIFGLMVSGAGSGLLHQPNAVLEMMNKQITNDLEAQKASKENAKNYLRLNMEHQMNQANVKHLDYNNALLQAQTAQVPISSEQIKANTRAMNAEAAIKADALARVQMNRSALHDLTLKVQSLPQGSPERAAAEQQLGLIGSSIDNENYSIADRAAAKAALGNAIMGVGGQTPSGDQNEQGFQKKQQFLRLAGHKEFADINEKRHLPGFAGQASRDLTREDLDKIQSGQALMESVKELQDFTKKNAGSLNPSVIAEGRTLAAQVAGQFRQATHGGVYKEGEQNFINRIIPEDPSQFLPDQRTLPKLKSVYDETQARTGQFAKSLGFKSLPQQKGASQDAQYKTVNGVKYMRGPNGEAVKVK